MTRTVRQPNQNRPQPPLPSDNGQEGTVDATSRPKLVFFWNNADVMKWLRRHALECYEAYAQCFIDHEITGRALVRMTDSTLSRMGVSDAKHREELLRNILKLKLKSDILELKNLESKVKTSTVVKE